MLQFRATATLVSLVFLVTCLQTGEHVALRAQESGLPDVAAQPSGEFGAFSAEFDSLYPASMSLWSSREAQLVRGLEQGDALRQKLLSKDAAGVSYVQHVCDAVAQLQVGSAELLEQRKSISRFDMSPERLQNQLQGVEQISAETFDAFNGRWFGRWGADEVNHDWQPTQIFEKPKRHPGSELNIHALQYAWISNGFGWNYLVGPRQNAGEQPSRPFVLGMVYYFDGQDFETIRGEKAHVGFVDSPTRLVWITAHEVFLEEVFPNNDPARTVYAITALYHNLLDANPEISKRATQAVYTRSPLNRPEFFDFQWR